ncbi:MAG: hypothetical protein ACK5JO_13165 [Halodesulfovibrio sp.]
MIFLQNVHEARERLADIAEQLDNGEIHSAVLLNEGVPVSVMVTWADFCVMLEALEAVSGSAVADDADVMEPEAAGHDAAVLCDVQPHSVANGPDSAGMDFIRQGCSCEAGSASFANRGEGPHEAKPAESDASLESTESVESLESADGKSFRLALDPILLD